MIGYVGLIGLLIGLYFYFEVYCGGVVVNLLSVSFVLILLLIGVVLVVFNVCLNVMVIFWFGKMYIVLC